MHSATYMYIYFTFTPAREKEKERLREQVNDHRLIETETCELYAKRK